MITRRMIREKYGYYELEHPYIEDAPLSEEEAEEYEYEIKTIMEWGKEQIAKRRKK